MTRARAEERNRSRAQLQLAAAGGGDGGNLVVRGDGGNLVVGGGMLAVRAVGGVLAGGVRAVGGVLPGAMQQVPNVVGGVLGHPAWFFFAGCGFRVLVVVLVFVWACRLQDGWFGWAETREAQLAEKSLVLLGKASASAASVASASAAAAASASAASVVCDYNTSAACLTVCGSVHAGAPEAELGARLGAAGRVPARVQARRAAAVRGVAVCMNHVAVEQ
jgi:hypothetical protein